MIGEGGRLVMSSSYIFTFLILLAIAFSKNYKSNITTIFMGFVEIRAFIFMTTTSTTRQTIMMDSKCSGTLCAEKARDITKQYCIFLKESLKERLGLMH